MNPRRFVLLGGMTLVTLGLGGVAGLLGRVSRAAFFHPPGWINWFHLALGSALLGARVRGSRRLQAGVARVGTVMGLTIGSLGLTIGPWAARRFHQHELADRSDHTAHLIVGLTALWAWLRR